MAPRTAAEPGIAHQMASAPRPEPAPPQPEKIPNRFDHVFGRIVFQPIRAAGDPLKFENGTTQTREHIAKIELGKDTETFITAHIVKRVSGDGKVKQLLLQWPSTGRGFRTHIIDPTTEKADADLAAYSAHVIEVYKPWRRSQKQAGNLAAAVVGRGAVMLTDDDMADLDL